MRSVLPLPVSCAAACLALAGLLAGGLQAQPAVPPAKADPRLERMLAWAEARLGTEYRFGGRLTRRLPGLDCLGLIFLAHARAVGGSWRDYSVVPSRMLRLRQLGPEVGRWAWDEAPPPCPGDLRRGDVLILSWPWEIEDEVLQRTPAGLALRSAHVGLYLGAGRCLHASPFAGRVVIEPLEALLREQGYLGMIAVRPFGASTHGR
ncbi:MAG TPA: NlpC/P60 family protein [Myxococcota bacterium]|nr:NlpC/P60 family protein [Myxococcota bacterium]HRY95897.1 NlpC/P60 family protein [Myxococcota bacterium]